MYKLLSGYMLMFFQLNLVQFQKVIITIIYYVRLWNGGPGLVYHRLTSDVTSHISIFRIFSICLPILHVIGFLHEKLSI